MKIETKLPFFPVFAKDILWETRDYDIATFGIFWKMLLLTWVEECRWIKDDENRGFKNHPQAMSGGVTSPNMRWHCHTDTDPYS